MLYWRAIGAALLGMWAIALHNRRAFPRLQVSPAHRPSSKMPNVSLLVPARNEADNIERTVAALLNQRYAHFELLVFDDESTDGTAELARRAGAGDQRLRVLSGAAKPTDWVGKNWACHQLAQAAEHDLLVFIDADVLWQPDALTSLIDEMEQHGPDLLTVWPTQITESWGERLTVPLMALVILGYLPVALVNNTDWPGTGIANGQCLAFRRSAYEQIGGHGGVFDQVLEDMLLAKRCKQERLRVRMIDGNRLISCRMYHNSVDALDGYAKNILAGHADIPALLLLSSALHLSLFVMPWLGVLGAARNTVRAQRALLVALGVGLRAWTAHFTHQRVLDALLMPLSTLAMTVVAARSLWWRVRFGGPRWKGRQINTQRRAARSSVIDRRSSIANLRYLRS